jgi:hypothetical protein
MTAVVVACRCYNWFLRLLTLYPRNLHDPDDTIANDQLAGG